MKKKLVTMLLAVLVVLTTALSPIATEKVSAAKKPGKVTISSITLNSNKPLIKWKAVSGATGYRVYRKTKTDSSYVKVVTTKNNSYTDKKVKAEAGSTVRYKVRAYAKDSKGKVTWGALSTEKAITLPAAKATDTSEVKTISYPVAVNEVNFPDDYFRKYVKDKYGDSLSEEEALSELSMNFPCEEIRSLKGIEFFPALEKLECSELDLQTIDLSNNTALKELKLEDCKLTSLDVSKNTELRRLDVFWNAKLTSLDVSNNTKLTFLVCASTGLTALDLSKNTALNYLAINDTSLNSIDITNNLTLMSLECMGCNKLTSLDISHNTTLIYLYCDFCSLSELDTSACKELRYLSCRANKLTSLNLENNTHIIELDCHENQLTALDVSPCSAITSLNCQDNQLKEIDVIWCSNLETLECSNNKLSELPLGNVYGLKRLYCNNNSLTSLDLSDCHSLNTLWLEGNPITRLSISDTSLLESDVHCDEGVEIIK